LRFSAKPTPPRHLKHAPGEGEKTQYCITCYTGKYPTQLVDVHLEELVTAKSE
jgi:glutamine phosphoribosylpyrophosphate amidotransferase